MQQSTINFDINKIIFDDPSSIFHILTESEKQLFCSHMEVKHYRKGEYICRTGEVPKGLLCLINGTAKIFRIGAGGRKHIFRIVKPNELIGYIALFADMIYGASARAIENSAAVIINRETMFSLLRSNSELSLRFIKSLSTELGFSYFRTMTLTQKQMPARLAESLLFLRDNYGFEDDNVTLKVCLSREDLASISNMTTSNAIRTLSSFARKNLISTKGKRIKLIDISGLEEISGEQAKCLKISSSKVL